jgi:Stage III sporulation protein AC/AD protein family.
MVQVGAIGIITVMLAVLFKKTKEELSLYLSLAACFLILLWGISKLQVILDAIDQLQGYINLNKSYIGILIKIIGITYITEISSSLCKDSGYQAISDQIEIVGKLTILAISMPIILSILETINRFLGA